MEYSLLGAALLAVGGFAGVLWWQRRRHGSAEDIRRLWDIALTAGITGLGVGRLAAMALAGTNPITHLGDVLIVRSGVDTGFASLGALAMLGWLARRDLWRTLDVLAPAVLAGLAAWHGSCLVRNACLGTPTGLPWGVSQSGSGISRHPVELYAALLLLAAAATLMALGSRRQPAGVIAGSALVAAGAARLLTEPLRPVIGSGPEAWYWAAVGCGAVSVVAAAVLGRRRNGLPDERGD